MRRVVITGLGALTPIGKNLLEYWDGLKNGTSGASMITRFNTEKFKTKFACEIKGYDSSDYFDRKEANKMDLYCQYAHIAAEEAVKDSGLDKDKVDKDRIGVIWSSGIGGLVTFYDIIKGFILGD
jgi:3-oxoacyl-[acyl-carrier-protein] synthase II